MVNYANINKVLVSCKVWIFRMTTAPGLNFLHFITVVTKEFGHVYLTQYFRFISSSMSDHGNSMFHYDFIWIILQTNTTCSFRINTRYGCNGFLILVTMKNIYIFNNLGILTVWRIRLSLFHLAELLVLLYFLLLLMQMLRWALLLVCVLVYKLFPYLCGSRCPLGSHIYLYVYLRGGSSYIFIILRSPLWN